MEKPQGVRKGAWSKEEDDLLRACIEHYGEGRWHLVPQRAGLNRCRRSCRLRWMNYLKPDIKRGMFSEDEVDMIMRLHRLLGNRWSLIAARLPGRTPNDVKNYWNTNQRKKQQYYSSFSENCKDKSKAKEEGSTRGHQVIKPQPLTFSRTSSWSTIRRPIAAAATVDDNNNNNERDKLPRGGSPGEAENPREWWESLLHDDVHEGDSLWCLDAEKQTHFWDEQFE